MAEDAFTSPESDDAPTVLDGLWAVVSPKAWLGAQRSDVASLLLVVAIVAGGLDFSVAVYRSVDMYLELGGAGPAYDAAYDPVVVEQGQVRVLGPRLPRFESPQQAFLVDPDETVAIESIRADKFLVVRRDTIIQKKALGQLQTTPVSVFQEMVGVDPLRVDGASIAAFTSEWGLLLSAGLCAFGGLVVWCVDVLSCLLYAAVASFALGPIAPQLTSPQRFRVALAASTATLIPGALATQLGLNAPCCTNLVLWPLVITGLAALAVHRR